MQSGQMRHALWTKLTDRMNGSWWWVVAEMRQCFVCGPDKDNRMINETSRDHTQSPVLTFGVQCKFCCWLFLPQKRELNFPWEKFKIRTTKYTEIKK